MTVRISTLSTIMAAALLKSGAQMSAASTPVPSLAHDEVRRPKQDRKAFASVRRFEAIYGRQLRQVARNVGAIIRGFEPVTAANVPSLQSKLRAYAVQLRPWATAVGERMVAEVGRRDKRAWGRYSADMSRQLKAEIETAPTGGAMLNLLAEQVAYITSLPIEAADRVHELTVQALVDGTRAREIAAEIARSGEVTASRANLIARTEVARTASILVQARAEHVGSEGYIWRTADDSDVRKEHRRLDGKFIRWDRPPIAGPKGQRYHAGQGPNCRCYPEPVVAEFKAEAA